MVQQADARKKFVWVNICIATAVFKDRKLSYVVRPQAHGDQFGAWSCDYINYYAQSRFGTAPENLKVAIIHDDGPYGVGVANDIEAQCKTHGLQARVRKADSATPY